MSDKHPRATGTCPCCSREATEQCPECGQFFCDVHAHTRRLHDQETPDMKDFKPTEVDKNFIRGIMRGLRVGGTWGYNSMPLVFQKVDDKTLAVVAAWPELHPAIENEIEKTRIVLEATGFQFKDLRAGEEDGKHPPK